MTQQQPHHQSSNQQQLKSDQAKAADDKPGPAEFNDMNSSPMNSTNNNFNSNSILRRNNRGCKSEDFYNWPEQSLDDMDSPLAVQQYIQQTIHRDPTNVDEILKLPQGQDLGAWKIEHLRLFCMQLNVLAARLQECCHPDTCNQMTATEQWIYLCAAHKQPNECPAIDYTRHTLDGAASLLNSNKYFPSRVLIKESSVAKLGSVCRRIYRIFSHAYYHHFQVYDEFERETHLCERFSKFVTMYELMSKDSLIVPYDGSKPEADTNIIVLADLLQMVEGVMTCDTTMATNTLKPASASATTTNTNSTSSSSALASSGASGTTETTTSATPTTSTTTTTAPASVSGPVTSPTATGARRDTASTTSIADTTATALSNDLANETTVHEVENMEKDKVTNAQESETQ